MIPRAERLPEVTAKLARLRAVMAAHGVDALELAQIANTTWLTAGASTYVSLAATAGASQVIVTTDRAFVMSDTIESTRLEAEERLGELGFEFVIEPWHSRGAQRAELLDSAHAAQDGPGVGLDLSDAIQALRMVLMPEEVARYRVIARLTAEAVEEAARQMRPGMSEVSIAGLLDNASRARSGEAIVNLVASDERIAKFRHPLPTDKILEHYGMIVLCLRKEGLVAAATRLVHFGALPKELRDKALAVAQVDARLITGTQAGRTMGEMFELAKAAYADVGYPEAIEQHHQGGSIGYLSREIVAQPGNPITIATHQAFAWNPSVRGVKSEDTVLLSDGGTEILTETGNWPTWDVAIGDQIVRRPAIIEQ